MDVRGALFALGHGSKKALGRVLGVARHKPDAEIARNGVDLAKELREIHILVQSPAIGVHVLAEERNILIPGGDKRFGLAHDVLAPAGTLAPADVGDDAVRAEVVAPVHDGEPCLHAAFPLAGETFGNGFGALGIEHATLRAGETVDLQRSLKKLREAPELVRAEAEIDHAVRLFHLLADLLALRHAAAENHDAFRVDAL